jgi:hypothetical protein
VLVLLVLLVLVLLVLADARAPGMQLSSARCLLSIDWGQLGLPSDHTREHLVKQVPLSCLFRCCGKKQQEKREDRRRVEC